MATPPCDTLCSFPPREARMSFRPLHQGPGIGLARLLLASVLVVMGAWRLWNVFQGGRASDEMLAFSVAGLLLGVTIAAGWRLRWTALLAAALVVAEAVLWHPFWSLRGAAQSAQLLHFMKNASMAGGFLLLSLTAPTRRR